jgi:hypothetical protein
VVLEEYFYSCVNDNAITYSASLSDTTPHPIAINFDDINYELFVDEAVSANCGSYEMMITADNGDLSSTEHVFTVNLISLLPPSVDPISAMAYTI